MTSKKSTAKKTEVAKADESAEKALRAGNALVEEVVKTGADTASKQVDQAVALTKDRVDQAAALTKDQVDKAQMAQKAALKGYDDLLSLQKDNFAAMVKSGNAVAVGYESISKEVMGLAQMAFEANLAATEALMGAKSFSQALDLQRSHMHDSLDKAIAGTSKLGELSVKVTSDAMAPLQARVNDTVERFTRPRAA